MWSPKPGATHRHSSGRQAGGREQARRRRGGVAWFSEELFGLDAQPPEWRTDRATQLNPGPVPIQGTDRTRDTRRPGPSASLSRPDP